jgi:hypothetical protein
MARLLFVVEDTFDIRRRGLILVPGISPHCDQALRVGDPLRLKRPDGSELETTIGGIEMIGSTTIRSVPIMLSGLSKEDVPIESEVWSVDRA